MTSTTLGKLLPYIAGILAGAFILVLSKQLKVQILPYPPGPKPLPLFGNLFDLPKDEDKSWLAYSAWNDHYGDIVSLNVLGRRVVILGSMAAVHDLFDKRSALYSSRPVQPIMELIGAGWQLNLLPYGDAWRMQRKLMHAHMHRGVVGKYQAIQINAARRLARDILATSAGTPEALTRAVQLNFGQSITKIVYGLEISDGESEYISLAEQILAAFSDAAIPGRYLVNFIPAMKYIPTWFPGARFQRYAQEVRGTQRRVRDLPIETVAAQMAAHKAPPSIARAMLEENVDLETLKAVTAIAYLAGSDTTVAVIVSFFLAMLVYPDVQVAAHAEVDRVVGTSRLPEPEDAANLPYVQGVVNECLRWLPVTPMGAPHCTTRDDEYRGYWIPKGSFVFGPVWRLLYNADDYPEPERFSPERYLAPDGTLDPAVRDPRTACFGFGRRICPGRAIAEGSLFATIATLLATVDVVRAKDAQGNEIVPEVDVTPGLLSHPKPFPWAVRPRSRHAEELLAHALVR